jgi:aryl-alcohol dehydrogenase-like predicted oxidoreductase
MKFVDVDGVGRVSRIGLGTWQFGSREWGYGDSYAAGAAGDIVRRARALGVTLFDTAEVYGLGKSERILGEALGDERADVAVASKIMPVAPFPAVSSSAPAPARSGWGWTGSRSTRFTSRTRWCRTR